MKNTKTIFGYLAYYIITGLGVGLACVTGWKVIDYAYDEDYRDKVNNKVTSKIKTIKNKFKKDKGSKKAKKAK